MKRLILLIFLLSTSIQCNAQNWISVGNDWYMDTSSQKLSGDIGSISIRLGSVDGLAEIDCKERRFISPTGLSKELIAKGSPLSKIVDGACKKWFQIWK